MTCNGRVNLSRVQMILTGKHEVLFDVFFYIIILFTIELGKVEDEIFKTRRKKDEEFRRRNKEKKRRNSVSDLVDLHDVYYM